MPARRSRTWRCRCRRAPGASSPAPPGWPADGYAGEYIADIAKEIADAGDLDAVRKFAVAYLRKEQDVDLQAFGVKFDVYYLESSLYTEGKVDATVQGLVASGKTYEKDGALWLRTTDYGDDKDRVMRKSDGSYTYFVPDVAYHVTKWQRGFRKVINVQGTDHHSTDHARARRPAGAGHRHPEGLSGLRAAQPGEGDARRRGSENLQARRFLRHRARPDRLGGPRRGAVLPGVAQSRHRVHFRHRPGVGEERGKPRVLRAVRACARLQRAGASGAGDPARWAGDAGSA